MRKYREHTNISGEVATTLLSISAGLKKLGWDPLFVKIGNKVRINTWHIDEMMKPGIGIIGREVIAIKNGNIRVGDAFLTQISAVQIGYMELGVSCERDIEEPGYLIYINHQLTSQSSQDNHASYFIVDAEVFEDASYAGYALLAVRRLSENDPIDTLAPLKPLSKKPKVNKQATPRGKKPATRTKKLPSLSSQRRHRKSKADVRRFRISKISWLTKNYKKSPTFRRGFW